MRNKKEIETKNQKGELNGYQLWYYDNNPNKIYLRAKYKNGNIVGYSELPFLNRVNFYIK